MADTPSTFQAAESYLAASLNLSDVTAATARANLAVEHASAYKTVIDWRSGTITDALVNTTTYVYPSSGSVAITAAVAGSGVIYLDPADYAVAGLTTKYLVKATLATNTQAALAITVTAGLYPIATSAGGVDINSVTVGTVTAGSTVAWASPAASTRFNGSSGDFTAPAANYFALGFVVSGTPTADSRASLNLTLLRRNT